MNNCSSTVATSDINMFIIDVLRYDAAEQVLSIKNMLNDTGCVGWRFAWPHDFNVDEIVVGLRELAAHGMIEVLGVDDTQVQLVPMTVTERVWQDLDIFWFALTDEGQRAWESWKPPTEAEDMTQRDAGSGA